ncbi:MAG TPA: hypothetical protein PKU80_01535 [Candidatus Limiplasma sp.]|nr:hypothetical protein [Candidatus Limiplasma sp.]HRX09324.1 hypothetical protein [Candidatus Limiplasma sp.]
MEKEQKLQALQKLAHRLNAAGIPWAVGGSMLLYFKGLVSEFRDIDIMVKAEDAEPVRAILEKLGTLEAPKPSVKFQSKAFFELTIDGVDVDVMAGFVIISGGAAHDCSLQEQEITESIQLGSENIPLHSLAAWRRNYELMGKHDKVRLIDENLL